MTGRRRSGPLIDAPTALEVLSAMAGNTTYRIPIGGRGTQAARTSLDIAGDLAAGASRMTDGSAWANIAALIATGRPTTQSAIADMVSAVLDSVMGSLSHQSQHKLRAGKLRLMLFMLVANAVGPPKKRQAKGGERYTRTYQTKEGETVTRTLSRHKGDLLPHPDFHANPKWIQTYKGRAEMLSMRLLHYSRLEREVQSIVEARISEAASKCQRER